MHQFLVPLSSLPKTWSSNCVCRTSKVVLQGSIFAFLPNTVAFHFVLLSTPWHSCASVQSYFLSDSASYTLLHFYLDVLKYNIFLKWWSHKHLGRYPFIELCKVKYNLIYLYSFEHLIHTFNSLYTITLNSDNISTTLILKKI